MGGALLREVSQRADYFVLTLMLSATVPCLLFSLACKQVLSSSAVLEVGMVEQGGVP